MAATGGVATATVASSNLSFQKDDPMKNQHVYMLFAREVGPLVKNKYPTIQKMQFNQILGRIWNELPPVEKNKYYVKADVQRKIQMNNPQGQAPILQRPSQPIAASPGPDSKITAPSGRTITTRPYERQKELSPYEIYSKGTKTILMKQYPYLNSRELEHLVIRMWSQLSPEEKDRYNRLSVKTPDPVSNNSMSHSNNAVEFINKVGVKVSEETADKTENIFMRGDSDSEDIDDAEETLNEQSTPPDTRSEEEIAIANIQPKTEPELPIMENVEDLNNSGSVEEEENGLNGKQAGNENDAKDTKEDNDEEEKEEEEEEENVDVDPLENDIKTTTTTYKLKTGEVVKSAKNNSENNESMKGIVEKKDSNDSEDEDEPTKVPTASPLKLPQSTVMHSNRDDDDEEDPDDPDDPDSLDDEEGDVSKQDTKVSRPSNSKRRVYDRPPGPVTVCYCLSNVTENLLGCDTCPEWYHPDCLGLSQHQMFDVHNVDTWRCPECVKVNSKPPTPKNKIPPASIGSPAKIMKLEKPPPAPVLVPIAPNGPVPSLPTPGPRQNQGSKCNTCKVLVDEVKRRGETIEKLKAKIKFLESRKDDM